MTTTARWTILAAVSLGLCGACSPGGRGLCQRLKDEDPAVRRQAVIEAGQSRDAQAVPLLVDCLEDSEGDIRFFAILALEKITGTTMGYKYYADFAERRQAVNRWREWLDEHPGGQQWAQAPVKSGP